ncbi:DNA topoisomerase 1-like [Eucalyptus grandis]|uniref:DNA topoisomerase 1-like n=1 Tax=Eucalyptus grandis TaxID=71139 RepID=UPI00052570FD|nr:DNA topoisomerase 1-like [Eucalyptus grandis]
MQKKKNEDVDYEVTEEEEREREEKEASDDERSAEKENEDEDYEGDTEKRSSARKEQVQEDEVSSPPTGTKAGGELEKTPQIVPTTSNGINRSPADIEDVFASHFPKVDAETPSQGAKQTALDQVDVPSFLNTPQTHFAEVSTQTEPKANYPRIVELFME